LQIIFHPQTPLGKTQRNLLNTVLCNGFLNSLEEKLQRIMAQVIEFISLTREFPKLIDKFAYFFQRKI